MKPFDVIGDLHYFSPSRRLGNSLLFPVGDIVHTEPIIVSLFLHSSKISTLYPKVHTHQRKRRLRLKYSSCAVSLLLGMKDTELRIPIRE
uniref:Uncharacterized protein n=1 Tax=Manihot esculenta TaxID=3983 RepID=A0A2C9WNS3_MANES